MLDTSLAPADERALLTMTTSPSNGALQQLINDHKDDAEKGHRRLREDVNGIGRKVDGFQATQTDLLLRVQRLELTPVNVEKVSFSSKQLLSVIGGCLIVAGGMWQLHVDTKDLHDAVVTAAKIQDERNLAQEKQMSDVKAELQLRRIEIQNLSNKLSDFMLQKGK